MAMDRLPDKLAVILHADIAGSTELVYQDKQLAHERIRDSFQRFSKTIEKYHGQVLEIRGDALLASFERGSDAVSAALAFQADQRYQNSRIQDEIQSHVRVGISLGEVVIADGTVTGTGVVQAQRVEQLANPDGVCITAPIHESLSKRMPFEFESLGEKKLKGFEHAVHVYRVELTSTDSIPVPTEITRTKALSGNRSVLLALVVVILILISSAAYWLKPDEPNVEAASIERMAFPLPDKPSIAILPFTNMSNDAEQEFFVDGMTEDLITDLSKVSGLFVIARNSVFTYKGKAVKVRQVAEELGVRYVMEGSVRRAGDQVRINAQLIDATTGGHVWADRYDGTYGDVFALQDRMTARIISALSLKLSPQEKVLLARHETASPEAYDEFLKGWELRWRVSSENYARAEQHFQRALELDPDYARAHAGLALLYMQVWQQSWHQDAESQPDGWRRAQLHLEAAMSNPDSLTHGLRSTLALYEGRHEKAISEARQAVALNPGSAEGYLALAEALSYSGEAMETIYNIELAKRLDPNLPGSYLIVQGRALFNRMGYRGSIRTFEKAHQAIPDDTQPLIYQIAAYGHLGETDYAGVALNQLNNLLKSDNLPAFTLSPLRNQLPYKSPEDLKHLTDGLVLGGVPER
jgi:TolB-like protein/class 3 adenylate cyclase/Flp pilus assembly protein TadD